MSPRRASKLVTATISPNFDQLKCIECIQKTFAKQHFEQLRLDFATTVIGFDPYSKVFIEQVDVCELDVRMRNDALTLLKEQRLEIWLHSMNLIVSSNRFPGAALIQSMLELILSVNQKDDETMDRTIRKIQSLCLLFETVVDNFPPSWSVCSNVYKSLFYNPINLEIDFKKLRMNATDGLFPILLALLDDAFKEVDQGNDSDNGFDSMMNFQQFEKVTSAKCSYTKLTRTEKIDRLFIVLSLLVKTMELDLRLWIQRYPFQTRHFMSKEDTCPLIAHLLWKGEGCGECNLIMRDILKLFATSIWIDFPDDKTNVLARLVNLMAVAVNLSENCDSDNLITYPNIKRLTETFAGELVKSIEVFPYTIKFYISVIGNIRSPAICMLVTLRILGKFTREFENVSLRKIVDSITQESYRQYAEKVNDDDNSATIRARSKGAYPTFDPKMNRKTSKHLQMDRDEYLTIVLRLFKSYVDVYRTHDLLAGLLSDDVADDLNSSERFKKQYQKVQIEKTHRHNLDQITKDLKRLRPAAENLASDDTMPVIPKAQCRNVYLEASDFVRCQEDIEYLLKLKEIVERNVQLGDTFKLWRTTVNEYFGALESV